MNQRRLHAIICLFLAVYAFLNPSVLFVAVGWLAGLGIYLLITNYEE